MEELAKKIIEYIKTGKQKVLVNNIYNEQLFHVILISIVEWLQLEYKRSLWMREKKYMKHKPLQINKEYDWCQELEKLIENEEIFKNNFCIIDNRFSFSDNVSEEDREVVRKYIYENYKVRVMT